VSAAAEETSLKNVMKYVNEEISASRKEAAVQAVFDKLRGKCFNI